MHEFSLENIMSSDVLSVEADVSLEKVSYLMRENHYSCILVAQHGKPVGIITERDMVKHMSILLEKVSSDKQRIVAADIMSTNLVTLNKNQTIMDALVISTVNKVGHIPVVKENEKLCGIVTYTDIANAHRNFFESQIAIVERSIHERTAELEEANRQLQELSMTDPLLGKGCTNCYP